MLHMSPNRALKLWWRQQLPLTKLWQWGIGAKAELGSRTPQHPPQKAAATKIPYKSI
jgi:hypothetical protein